MRRRELDEPALISASFSFLLRLSEVKYHWLKSRTGGKTVNLSCLMRGDQTMESVVNMEQEEQFNGCIFNMLAKFQSVSGLNLELTKEQETASLLMDRDVLTVFPTGYGKSLIFQTYVMAAEQVNKGTKASMLVISTLTSIIQDQIVEARSFEIMCVSLLEITFQELKKSAFHTVFTSAEGVMENEFRNTLKDSSSLLHKNIYGIVVCESHTVETWTGKRFVPIAFNLLQFKSCKYDISVLLSTW